MNAHAHQVLAAIDARQAALPVPVDALLRDSWRRSVTEHGLEPDRIAEPEVLTQAELRTRRAPVEELSALSSPEIDRLYQRLSDHAEVVMLTDAQGVVVHFRSAAAVSGRCSDLRVLPGSIWTEERQGTTGIGLCLRAQRPLSVVMDEHFATQLTALSCTVAPIFGAEGRLAGVLNVTAMRSSSHALQAVLRELVASSARRIENLYFDRRHVRQRVLRLSRHDDFIDGAAEARLALDAAGRIVDATPLAQRLLAGGQAGGSDAPLIGRRFGSVAGVASVERLLAQPAPAIDLGPGGARRLHVRLGEPARRGTGSAFVTAPAPAPAPRAAPASAAVSTPAPTPAPAPAGGAGALTLAQITGADAALATQLQLAQRLHARGLPLLLQGETGSGKTRLAQALHAAGPHRGGPFVAINCAAIPEPLIESELFGHRAGAFTGAQRQGAPGRLLAADGGTLFLDEIGDMPLALQGRLLQVLSDGEFVPLGATVPVRLRFALVSATLHDLRALVRAGRFRDDLFHRLAGATLQLPPLRARGDLDALLDQAFARAAAEAGLPPPRLAMATRALLRAHAWPGNLRELAHVARYALAAADGDLVDPEALPPLGDADAPVGAAAVAMAMAVTAPPPPSSAGTAPAAADAAAAQAALMHSGWNVSAAAARLGVSRATLHRRILVHGLQRPARR